MPDRRGIFAAGNYIVDRIKLIDTFPAPETLVDIVDSTVANGGGPYNVLKDLAVLSSDIPRSAAGRIGVDAEGQWIAEDCRSAGIDTAQLNTTSDAPTSYTDAMTETGSGRRTFFHCRGANDLFVNSDVDVDASSARWFYLGFLGLLQGMDRVGGDGQTDGARLLARARAAGMLTAADAVSLDHPDMKQIVAAVAPHLDVLFLNERELGTVLGRDLVDASPDHLENAAIAGRELGAGTVVVHCTQGAVAATEDGPFRIGSVTLADGFIVGSTGAGDAFAAGYLIGLHEGASVEVCLQQAVGSAAMSLSAASASGGMKPLAECLGLAAAHGLREF
jgi:sugar/nucleoside kinase (ribokinase family)